MNDPENPIYQGRMQAPRVLLVEDEPVLREVMRMRFAQDFRVAAAESGESAVAIFEREPPDVILTDKNLPGMSGLELLKVVKQRNAEIEVLLITGYASLESALEATRSGAFDYLLKPLDSIEIAVDKVRRAAERRRLLLERRQTEQTLKSREAHYRSLVQTSPDGIMLIDLEGVIRDANPQMAAIRGSSAYWELIGQNAFEFIAERDRKKTREQLHQLAAADRIRQLEVVMQRLDGVRITAELSASIISEADGRPRALVVVVRDVTDLKRLRAKLAQSDRLASLGMLAAGVAHEINNPLSYVMYNLGQLKNQLQVVGRALTTCRAALTEHLGLEAAARVGEALIEPDAESLEEISELTREAEAGAERVREIVRDLKSFSRVEEDRRGLVDLRIAIESAINMSFNEIKYRATLIKDYGQVPPVYASLGRLSQIVLNLLVNAAQAIEEGHVEQNQIRIRTYQTGDLAVIEVRDTGCGIALEQLDHLFDPFHSTKPDGQNSGLGLFICHNLVTAYGGSIRVESEVGRGTAFWVSLPCGHSQMQHEPRPAVRERTDIRGKRILVVDDDPMVGKMLFRQLRDRHQVQVATSGEEAMQILERSQEFDIIVCDLLMQRVTGMDLHAWLKEFRPALAERMIFTTGGSFTARSQEFAERFEARLIEKPIDGNKLRILIDSLLDAVQDQSA